MLSLKFIELVLESLVDWGYHTYLFFGDKKFMLVFYRNILNLNKTHRLQTVSATTIFISHELGEQMFDFYRSVVIGQELKTMEICYPEYGLCFV